MERLKNLDWLRFCGAFVVFIFHLFSLERECWGPWFHTPTWELARKCTNLGSYGVNLFFILSAFLIGILFLDQRKKTNRFSQVNFMKRRMVRLLPLYGLILAFIFFLFPALPYGKEIEQNSFYFLFFIGNFASIFEHHLYASNALTSLWSISVEFQFYVVFTFISIVAVKVSHYLVYFSSLLIIVSFVFRLVYFDNPNQLYYNTMSLCSDFGFGMLIAYFWHFSKTFRHLIHTQAFSIILFSLFFILVGVLLPSSFGLTGLIMGLGFSCLLLYQLSDSNKSLGADNFPFFKFLGQRSFGIYVYHPLIMYYLSHVFESYSLNNSIVYFGLYALLSFLFTLVISSLSYRYFEQKFLRFKC
jgi:peptidoglycan/LPS O-acetylase OafA/YrhL